MPIQDDEKRKQYMKEYYAKNREKLAARRRDRYAENADQVRAVQRVKMRMRRAKERALTEAELEEVDNVDRQKFRYVKTLVRLPRTKDHPEGEIVSTNLYPINVAANFIGVTRRTFRKWIEEGKIPSPSYTTQAGRACYTEQQCVVMRDTVLIYTNNGRKELVSQPGLFDDMLRGLSELRFGVLIEEE
jgi:hypothetical protein